MGTDSGRVGLDRFVESRRSGRLSDRIWRMRIRTTGWAVLGLAVLVAIAFWAKATEDTPVLIGTNSDEGAPFLNLTGVTAARFEQKVREESPRSRVW